MARVLNINSPATMKLNNYTSNLLPSQRKITLIAEMIHVSSLIHDDIIDNSDLRRGKQSVNNRWGCDKAVLAGDYIVAMASSSMAKIGNVEVVETLSKVLTDLVHGELMQFGNKESTNERFDHYTKKTYRKTASLIANSCRAVGILLADEPTTSNNELSFFGGSLTKRKSQLSKNELVTIAFECGKNVGIGFQLIDDILDFTASDPGDNLGKPGQGADLRLGLATAPVLFAAAQYPELNTMIMRRFSEPNDALKAFEIVKNSNGIDEARFLAKKYIDNAIDNLKPLNPSKELEYFKEIIRNIGSRKK
jgi:decaprenyl-diphosphate synthase subunit 1